MKERKLVKIKVKKVYKDEVEPTLSLDIDLDSNEQKDKTINTIVKLLKNVMDADSNIKGIFVSADK